jgi:hypothetical protein
VPAVAEFDAAGLVPVAAVPSPDVPSRMVTSTWTTAGPAATKSLRFDDAVRVGSIDGAKGVILLP